MVRAIACMAALWLSPWAQAYSVLTHEAIIDSAWTANIKPLLLARFPQASADDLLRAHAYAYGGCIIQDMGYYPFGSKFFSDLVHYVRTGDFVQALVSESQDLDEYAFALGSLAHYAADNEGHSIAVNPAVGAQFPKLAEKFGPVVTYADDPTAHLRVEFGFDVLQVARGSYAPQAYHDFVGFEVARPVLERAFQDTYSLELKSIFTSLDLALGTYRRAVSTIIPDVTRVAWHEHKKELMRANPAMTRRRFVFNLSRASFRREWTGPYREPGLGARILAFFIRILPKIGPLKAAAFKPPTTRTASWFEDSFNKALDMYRGLLTEVSHHQLRLANRDFDTGKLTEPAEYRLADDAYSKLAVKLSDHDPATLDPKLRQNVLDFYRNLDLPFATKQRPEEWSKTMAALGKLRAQASGPAL